MGKTMEELDRILEEKDRKIYDLEQKIANLEYQDEWKWRKLRQLTEEENMGLPVPRLELRYRSISDFTYFIEYNLVYRHFLDTIEVVPLSCTKISGRYTQALLELPFRDGCHIYSDMFALKLLGFVVNGEQYRELHFTDEDAPLKVKGK